MADRINVQILDDGTAKLTTDKVSAANHKSADEMFKYLATLLGGDVQREKRKDRHTHAHEHDHAHEHEHE